MHFLATQTCQKQRQSNQACTPRQKRLLRGGQVAALVLLILAAGVARADLDGDGLADGIFANQGTPNLICLGDGAGGFSSCSNVSADSLNSWGAALGDLDGDNDLDVAFANDFQRNRKCINTGGTFVCTDISTDTSQTYDLALGDLDGDNDLDIVFANFTAQINRVCINDGSGAFTCSNISGDAFWSADVALGDVDGDNDLDAVFANEFQTNRLCTNDGSGSFTCADFSTTDGALWTKALALGDVDGDNDLDAVFGNIGPNRLCTNDGSGSFTCADLSADNFGTWRVVLGDVDGDNDFDAVFANGNSAPNMRNRVCTNDGSGGFACADVSADNVESRGPALSTLLPAAPELAIASDIPAAESEAVDVDVSFTANGTSIVATAFSVDYDATCLFFDDSDFDPIDGIPDDLTVHVPGDFGVTVFHDLGDADGEIDILISDFSPPLATLTDGPLVTATFTSICSPALGSTVTAPVVFSTDPAATFSDDMAQNVSGTVVDGSVEIFPGPRGDCNGDGTVGVADAVASGLEIFDGDGTFWADAVGGSFPGNPVGCDSNADDAVNAGDVSCTTLLIFGGSCSGGGLATIETAPELSIDASARLGAGGSLWLPVELKSQGHGISSLVFSLNLNTRRLRFDSSDRDRDGLPDAVRFPAGAPSLIDVRFDPRDRDGEIDFVLSDLSGAPLPDGVILEIRLEGAGKKRQVARSLRFSKAPEASFGSVTGDSVPGRTMVVRRPLR